METAKSTEAPFALGQALEVRQLRRSEGHSIRSMLQTGLQKKALRLARKRELVDNIPVERGSMKCAVRPIRIEPRILYKSKRSVSIGAELALTHFKEFIHSTPIRLRRFLRGCTFGVV